MKVYLVEKYYPYEGATYEGVFSTLDLAEAYVDKMRPCTCTHAELEIYEIEVDGLVVVPRG